jgi:hypothetical protein
MTIISWQNDRSIDICSEIRKLQTTLPQQMSTVGTNYVSHHNPATGITIKTKTLLILSKRNILVIINAFVNNNKFRFLISKLFCIRK